MRPCLCTTYIRITTCTPHRLTITTTFGGPRNVHGSLTTRQREVLEFIRDKIHNRGYGPTVREIGEKFDISSPNGVMCHLKALEKKGIITREPNMSRAIQLTDVGSRGRGHSAGRPHRRRQPGRGDRAGRPAQLRGMFPAKKNSFALQVRGDSMIEAEIADGDIVICKKTRWPTRATSWWR